MEVVGQLSALAALAYLATGGMALVATVLAPVDGRRRARFNWIAVAVVVVVLAVWRLTNGEAVVQDFARTWARNSGVYDDRHSVQVPVTLGAVLMIAALIWLARRSSGAGSSGKALSVALIMVVFTAVRATSLHAVDALLYESVGLVHVNYLIDLGLTALVAGLALVECRRALMPPKGKRRTSSRRRHHR